MDVGSGGGDNSHLFHDSKYGDACSKLDVKEQLETRERNKREHRAFEFKSRILQRATEVSTKTYQQEMHMLKQGLQDLYARTPYFDNFYKPPSKTAHDGAETVKWSVESGKDCLRPPPGKRMCMKGLLAVAQSQAEGPSYTKPKTGQTQSLPSLMQVSGSGVTEVRQQTQQGPLSGRSNHQLKSEVRQQTQQGPLSGRSNHQPKCEVRQQTQQGPLSSRSIHHTKAGGESPKQGAVSQLSSQSWSDLQQQQQQQQHGATVGRLRRHTLPAGVSALGTLSDTAADCTVSQQELQKLRNSTRNYIRKTRYIASTLGKVYSRRSSHPAVDSCSLTSSGCSLRGPHFILQSYRPLHTLAHPGETNSQHFEATSQESAGISQEAIGISQDSTGVPGGQDSVEIMAGEESTKLTFHDQVSELHTSEMV